MMNESTNIETEIKVRVPDLAAVAERLSASGATLTSARVFERNVRYEDAGNTLTGRGIVVRLRKDSRVRLTYKDPGTAVDGILSRFEAEVEVGDFDMMNTILGKLGYYPHMVYEKYRTTYEMNDTEVVLDEMPFGPFVEIEGKRANIVRTVARLELVEAPRYTVGYARLFEYVRHHLRLDFRDLTFALRCRTARLSRRKDDEVRFL